MAYADIVTTEQQRTYVSDALRRLYQKAESEGRELTIQDFIDEFGEVPEGSTVQDLLNALIEVVGPTATQDIGGIPPTPPPGQPPTPSPGQPPTGEGMTKQDLLNLILGSIGKEGGLTAGEVPWTVLLNLLQPEKEKKGQFRYSRSGTPGYMAKWKIDPESGDETFVDIVPTTAELKDMEAKPSARYQQDESGQWYQYEVDESGNMIEGTVRPFGAAPKGKEPYSTELTPAQERFMEQYRKTQAETSGELPLSEQMRLGLLVPETLPSQTPGGWGIRGYRNIQTGAFIPTGQIEPEPKFTGGRTTKPTGKVDPYGNEWVQDYEIDKWTGKEMPVGNPYPRYTEAPAGLVGYRGPRGQVMSPMEVERMRASMENAPSDNMSPGSIAARSGYRGEQVNIPGVSPGDWQALMTAQREAQSIGSAMGGLANEKYLGGVIGQAVQQWPLLGLPQQAQAMDKLKGMGISFPGQPRTISFGYGTTAPAPSFPLEQLRKPPVWLTASPSFGAPRQG